MSAFTEYLVCVVLITLFVFLLVATATLMKLLG